MSSFNEGDIVLLKSGGPEMTYVGDDEIGYAICIWFDNSTKRSDSFPQTALKKKEPFSLSGSVSR